MSPAAPPSPAHVDDAPSGAREVAVTDNVAREVRDILRAQEMAGERLVNKIRLVYGLAGLAMAVAASGINTPASNHVFLVQGSVLVACCLVLFAWFRARRDVWVPWLKYLTITFDIAVVHLSVLATARNHSGVIEYFHSFFPIMLVLWNLLSGLRYSVRASLYSAAITATMSAGVLVWVANSGLVEVSETSVWGADAINLADESMRIVFVSASGLVAAVLARIARSLIQRAEEESRNRAELERQKARLSKYLGGELAGVVVSQGGDLQLGGTRRDATVVFTDIRNFTSLSAQSEPERVVAVLNEYFARMVAIVFRYGGTLDKFLGDGLMAVYGAPFDRERSPVRAVLTALEMVREVDAINAERGYDPPLRVGAGIATGPVIAGNIGSEDRMEYTVIGDAVNLAARLEALNRDMGTQLIISESTWRGLPEWLPSRALPPLRIRGLRGEAQLYVIDPDQVDDALLERLRALLDAQVGVGPGVLTTH